MGIFPGFGTALLVGLNKPTRTYVDTSAITSSSSSFTFTDQNIGGPGLIVVAVGAAGGGSPLVYTGVTFDGSAATLATKQDNETSASGLYYKRVAAGSTSTIVVNMTGTASRCSVSVYRLRNVVNDTPYDTKTANTGPASVSLNIPANGVAIAIASRYQTSSATVSWTGITEDRDNYNSNALISSASAQDLSAEVGRSIVATASSANSLRLAAASWA